MAARRLRLFVVAGLVSDALGNGGAAREFAVVGGSGGGRLRRLQLRAGDAGLRDAGTAEDDDGGLDALLLLQQFGLQQLQLQSHRTQLRTPQKVHVGIGKPVGRGCSLRTVDGIRLG